MTCDWGSRCQTTETAQRHKNAVSLIRPTAYHKLSATQRRASTICWHMGELLVVVTIVTFILCLLC